MEVAVGAVVDEETRVVRDFEVGVERREERVVEQGEDLSLGLGVGELFRIERVAVDDLEGEVGVVVVAEAAEEDAAKVAGAEAADELEVPEMEEAVGGQGSCRLDGRPVRVGSPVGPVVDDGGGGGGGGGGEAGLVEAEGEAAAG